MVSTRCRSSVCGCPGTTRGSGGPTESGSRLLTACRDGQVQLSLAEPGYSWNLNSPWVVSGQRLPLSDPDSAELAELARRSLTHECDSQEITAAGEALLREWTR